MEIDTYDDTHSYHRHKQGWRLQSIFHVVLLMVLVLGALGVFGNGLLSAAMCPLRAGGALQYDRFARLENTDPIRVLGGSRDSVPISIAFPITFYKYYTVEAVEPKPIRIYTNKIWQTYAWPSAAAGSGIFFRIKAHKAGRHQYTLNVQGQACAFDQFVWP